MTYWCDYFPHFILGGWPGFSRTQHLAPYWEKQENLWLNRCYYWCVYLFLCCRFYLSFHIDDRLLGRPARKHTFYDCCKLIFINIHHHHYHHHVTLDFPDSHALSQHLLLVSITSGWSLVCIQYPHKVDFTSPYRLADIGTSMCRSPKKNGFSSSASHLLFALLEWFVR